MFSMADMFAAMRPTLFANRKYLKRDAALEGPRERVFCHRSMKVVRLL